MRVVGSYGTAGAGGISEGPIRSIEDPGGKLQRIGKGEAWALVRTGLPDLAFAQEPDGSFIIVDGEVFAGLDGPLGRHSLTKLLCRARSEGPSCLAELNGTASIVLWDAAARRLTLARDRWGFGSCFWIESAGGITFASDIRSLIRSDPRAELDEAALDIFLAGGFISAPWTSLAHIRKLPSSHCLTVDSSGMRLSRYWRATGHPKLRLPLERRKELLEQVLLQAVERQLPGRAKPAILLSGGIDSMYLAALLVRKFGLSPAAFTYRYSQYHGKFNESDRALATARLLGIEHHEMTVGPQDVVDNLERMLIEHNGPLSYGAHSAILKDVVGAGIQILYNGQGNGALYPSPAERLGLLLNRPLARRAMDAGLEGILDRNLRWSAGASYALRVAATGLNWRFHAPLTSDEIRRSLYLDPERLERGGRASRQLFAEAVAEFSGESGDERLAGPLHRLYSADGTLTWSSSFGRAHGLSPRSPYYDNAYVELLYRMRRSGGKREIRELAAKLLPEELAFTPKNAQTIPVAHWFRGPLSAYLAERLRADRVAEGGLFRYATIRELHRRHRDGAASHGWTLWNILVITEWREIVSREAGLYLSGAREPRARQVLHLA